VGLFDDPILSRCPSNHALQPTPPLRGGPSLGSARLHASVRPMKAMTAVDDFCRQVCARSAESRQAMDSVRVLPGQMVSVLRQELDSPVRVVFLLAQEDRANRHRLIEDSVSGRRWKEPGSRKVVTDREMVDLTERLHGCTRSVYAFGWAFIHRSSFHDHKDRNPLDQVSEAERNAILGHRSCSRARSAGPCWTTSTTSGRPSNGDDRSDCPSMSRRRRAMWHDVGRYRR